MELTPGPVPLYHQLAEIIRDQIKCKKLKEGDPIPTEKELSEIYGVSRITVRRAIDDLIAENLIKRKRGVGTFVDAPSSVSRSVSLIGSLYDALSYPKHMTIDVIDKHVVKSPKWVAKELGIATGEKAFHCKMLSSLKDQPFAYTNFYFTENVGKGLNFDQLGDGAPVAALVEKVIGEPVVRARQTVQPELADDETASALKIKRNTPLLHVYRTYFTADDNPVETVSVCYHPDQYRLTIDLLPSN